MSGDYRHHHAPRPSIVFVLPEAGSPKEARRPPPPRYPSDKRQPWRPQRAIPPNRKAEGVMLSRRWRKGSPSQQLVIK